METQKKTLKIVVVGDGAVGRWKPITNDTKNGIHLRNKMKTSLSIFTSPENVEKGQKNSRMKWTAGYHR